MLLCVCELVCVTVVRRCTIVLLLASMVLLLLVWLLCESVYVRVCACPIVCCCV